MAIAVTSHLDLSGRIDAEITRKLSKYLTWALTGNSQATNLLSDFIVSSLVFFVM